MSSFGADGACAAGGGESGNVARLDYLNGICRWSVYPKYGPVFNISGSIHSKYGKQLDAEARILWTTNLKITIPT